ncbi:DUF2333 family protein [Salinicola avicenniae]|uniref:DUF2333 family protein n=1 Tax=Salinicola avicenniae TaxID=2916836 RepID=UPI0020740127|nr:MULTISPECIES: DUF2333 family protein [unclassified Salinicola]
MALFRKTSTDTRTNPLETPQYGWIWKPLVALVVIYLLVCIVLGIWWSWTPSPVSPQQAVERQRGFPQAVDTGAGSATIQPGEALLATNLAMLDTLLNKPGGYLRNDVMPPGLWLDNMPNWEKGVTRQVQDAVAALGDGLDIGQAPLSHAEDALGGDLDSWRWPTAEKQLLSARNDLGEAFTALENASRASSPSQAADTDEAAVANRDAASASGDESSETDGGPDSAADGESAAATPGQSEAPGSPSAENLSAWLAVAQQRLRTQTRQLAANVGQSPSGDVQRERTPWFHIDNVFFEARGTTWALAQLMRAAQIDYAEAIETAGASTQFDQLIAELEASQARLWSPVILNGSGFGLFANHSLMMANYTVRATQLIGEIRAQL